MGLVDTLTLFGVVALAAPIGLLGIEFLVGGRPVAGAGFLAVAIGVAVGVYARPSLKSVLAARAVNAVEDGDGNESGDEP